ncbi:MAG: SHOCT domain-containing protein [Erythrobacter sp.]
MDSAILGALISAAASMLAAYIGRPRASGPTRRLPERLGRRNANAWLVAYVLSIGLIVYAAIGVHSDLAGTMGFAFPLVLVACAAFFPIRPAYAVAASLAVLPFMFLAEPFSHWVRGNRVRDPFSDTDFAVLFLGVSATAVVLVGLITAWRWRNLAEAHHRAEEVAQEEGLPGQLSALARLHRSGALSDEEYARAKDKLLS